jgi:ADP-heptose:LPS heptosyltransferase
MGLVDMLCTFGQAIVRPSPAMQKPEFLSGLIQRGAIKKILIIQLQQLGDNLVFTPTVKAITESFKHLQVDMLVNSVGYEVYRNMPSIRRFYVDSSWYWGRGERKLLPLLKLINQIRREQYDLAILDAQGISLKYPLIARLTGARFRLGFDFKERGFLNTTRVPFHYDTPFTKKNLELLDYLGVEQPAQPTLFFPTTTSDTRDAEALINSFGISPADKLIVIHQGTNWSSKQWFPESWVALSRLLLEDSSVKLLFSGAAREKEQVDAILHDLRSERAFSVVNQSPLHVLKEVIEYAQCFITLDTGPMHVGNATTTPMIVLMSAIDREDFWIEPSERVRVLRKEIECKYCHAEFCPLGTKECMKRITPREVYEAYRAQLAQRETTRI